MTPGRFEDLRRVFLEGGSVQSWREAREAAQARKESRTESPLVQEVWGQLDREAIGRNPDFGPDVVTALEERYGRGIFARGKDATGQRAANLDKAVQSLAYRGLVPAESTADDLLRHLAFGDALNAGEQTLFQPTREDIRAGDEALKRDAAAWAGTVDGYIENAGKRRDKRHSVTMLRSTPLVLQMLGAKNLRFNASLHLLKDGLGRHDLPADVIKQLPEALADPVMIFSSATQAGDLVVMLDLKDRHGGTVVVPVALEIEEGSKAYTVNMATTVYGKSDEKRGKPKDGWFAEQIRAGNLRYRNERKSREWQRKADPGRTHWGPIPRVAPRLSGSASRAKIFTEADLVKLREANPTLYQKGGPSQARGAYVLRQDGAALIALFRGKADISTVIHEGAGHFFLENLREAAQLPDAPAWVTEGWRTVAGAIGADADPATAIATGAHETFARMAVDYMRSGRAPSDRLAQVFRRFARWLGAIWRRVRRRPDFAEVSPEVAAVMDRLLAAEEDIAATRDRVAPLPETAPEGVMPEAWADYLRLARKAESDAAALLTLRRMAWERAVERAARKEARALRAEDPDQRRVGAFAACIPRVLDIQKSCVRCLAHDFFALF